MDKKGRILGFGAIIIGFFMALLDATIVNVALPSLMAAFGVSVDSVEWVLTASGFDRDAIDAWLKRRQHGFGADGGAYLSK